MSPKSLGHVTVRARMRPGWYWWAAMLASSLSTGLAALLIAVHVSQQSDRSWCSVVATLDDAWRETPPTTPSGRNLARDISQLRHDLDCPR